VGFTKQNWLPMAQWDSLAPVAGAAVGFDHSQILSYGHQRLRNKLEYSPVVFEVPEVFTL